MNRARLETMTLDELHRLAAEHGIREAPGLPRELLVDRLAAFAGEADELPVSAPEETRPPPIRPTATPRERASNRAVAAASSKVPDRSFAEDPVAMAKLYLAQGQAERAAELYRELLSLHPDDAKLSAELAKAEAAVRERADAAGLSETKSPAPAEPTGAPPSIGPPPAVHREPMGMLDLEEPPEAYGVDECEVIARDPHSLFVYWEVTEQGIAAARRDLGDEASAARLVLRLVTHAAGEKGPERESRDHGLDWNHGRRYFPSPRPGVRVRVAVGLVTPSGLFAPIAQSSKIRVPPAEPASAVSTEWMEVRPTKSAGRDAEPIEIVTRGPSTREHGERGVIPGVGPVPATPSGAPTSPDHGKGPGGSSWRWRPGSQG